ncbi:MAG: HEAT repeat domain-containing protein [Pirellulales bacterium]
MHVRFICGVAIGLAAVLFLAGTTTAQQGNGQGPTLEELAGRLRDGDFGARLRTLNYIGAMKPHAKEIAPDVIRLLKDPNYRVRAGAANALGNLQNALPDLGKQFPECVPQLIRMLSDKDPEDQHQLVRRFAAYALRALGESSKAAVPGLLKIASNKDDNVSVRAEAVQALGEIGQASPEVVAALVKLLDDPARINEHYPTIGSTASSALGRFKANADAAHVLIERLELTDAQERAAAAAALGTTGFGMPEAEDALLELLDDKSTAVQKAALSSLEGINDTYAFFFRHNVVSSAVTEKRRALLQEIGHDAVRKAPVGKILAAQIRLGEGHQPKRADALRLLVEIDAREYLPMLKEQFNKLEKKTVYLEGGDLRLQLLITLAAWLPDKEAVPFLIGVDTDADETPQVRFRAAILLCERGDAVSVSHIVKQHLAEAEKVKSLVTIETLQKSLEDRRLFFFDQDFEGRKAVGPDELKNIYRGIQFAQYFYGLQRREAIRDLSLSKIRLHEGKIESMHFRMTVPSEGWSFELRKKGDWWLPCSFRMEYIE